MKYDMAGAAAVIGAMQAIAQLKPSVPVTGYVPTVENAIGGNAQRPGDIITTLSGKTVEVLNTDAEDRLILADAITYANRSGATHMVDAATLTGAIAIALGHHNVGAFTNNQPLLDKLLAAARVAGRKDVAVTVRGRVQGISKIGFRRSSKYRRPLRRVDRPRRGF